MEETNGRAGTRDGIVIRQAVAAARPRASRYHSPMFSSRKGPFREARLSKPPSYGQNKAASLALSRLTSIGGKRKEPYLAEKRQSKRRSKKKISYPKRCRFSHRLSQPAPLGRPRPSPFRLRCRFSHPCVRQATSLCRRQAARSRETGKGPSEFWISFRSLVGGI
jgi:hypothetical protein